MCDYRSESIIRLCTEVVCQDSKIEPSVEARTGFASNLASSVKLVYFVIAVLLATENRYSTLSYIRAGGRQLYDKFDVPVDIVLRTHGSMKSHPTFFISPILISAPAPPCMLYMW